MPLRLLLTAFGPFAHFSVNPSEQVLRRMLPALSHADTAADAHVLEVSYQAVDALVDALADTRREPLDLALHMGVATGAPKLRLELVARNTAAGADVRSATRDPVIRRGAPDLPTRFPRALLHDFATRHTDAVVLSEDAGAYLCNYLYFRSSERLPDATPVLFVHIADFVSIPAAPGPTEQSSSC